MTFYSELLRALLKECNSSAKCKMSSDQGNDGAWLLLKFNSEQMPIILNVLNIDIQYTQIFCLLFSALVIAYKFYVDIDKQKISTVFLFLYVQYKNKNKKFSLEALT